MNELDRRDEELTCRLDRRVSDERKSLEWLEKSNDLCKLVGVVGSERMSLSKPPALIFMMVSFSGVISGAGGGTVAMAAD